MQTWQGQTKLGIKPFLDENTTVVLDSDKRLVSYIQHLQTGEKYKQMAAKSLFLIVRLIF